MPITTLNPTSLTNPDQGGTTAFDSANNTSGSSGGTASGSGFSFSDALAESARWHGFTYSGPAPTQIRLKFTWDADGQVSMDFPIVGSGSASASFSIESSTDGGSNWQDQASGSVSLSDEGSDSFDTDGSVDFNISPGTTISNIQARARVDASVSVSSSEDGNTASASIFASLSNIRLEITTPESVVLVMM